MWCLPPARPSANIFSFTSLNSPESKILGSHFKKRGLGGSDWLSDLLKDTSLLREGSGNSEPSLSARGLFPSPTLRTHFPWLSMSWSPTPALQQPAGTSNLTLHVWRAKFRLEYKRLEMSNLSPTPSTKCVAWVKSSTLKKMRDGSKCKVRLGVGGVLFPCDLSTPRKVDWIWKKPIQGDHFGVSFG